MIKKYILGALVALSLPALIAYAATPSLTVTGNGDNNAVTVTVSGGEPNADVVLFYNPSTAGTVSRTTVGRTDQNGYWTGTVSGSSLGIPVNGQVYVQVGGYQSLPASWTQSGTTSGSGGNLTFNITSPSFGVGQNGMVTISGGNGTYYISSNSNASGVGATISGNTLTLLGSAPGTANIQVCSTSGSCGTIAATVNSNNSNAAFANSTGSGAPSLSQSALSIGTNGSGSITLSGGAGPYTVNVPAGSGITTTMIGNTLYVNGTTAGTTSIQVCSANMSSANGGCTYLPVTVGAGSTATTGSTGSSSGSSTGNNNVSFAVPVNVGTPVQLLLTGGNGSGTYYIQTSNNSTPVTATISGNTLTINGTGSGTGTVTVCSTGGNCLPIALNVMPALTGIGGGYFFDNDLTIGSTGQDVMELQSRLASEGYFQAAPTGYFGPITMAAVQSYQRAHGVSATGYVGPLTRAELNK